MLDSETIVALYQNVIDNEIKHYNIPIEAIILAIESMAHVYKPETGNLNSIRSTIADYSDVAHRNAYLHKYAAFHTVMVRDMLHEAITSNYDFFYKLLFSSSDRFRLCSLGGGPGSDIIGVLAALHGAFSYFDASATVIDYMADWKHSFSSILEELGSGMYGAFGNNISHFLNWRYVGANLLKTFSPDVNEALSSASFITMIKFVSATTCQDTKAMIKNIFAAMRPGAVVLYIDNDGGGFHNLMMDAAYVYNFIPVFGPFRRETYINTMTKVNRFGYASCSKTTVTVHVLQKPFPVQPYGIYPGNPNQRTVIFGSPFVRSPSLLPHPSPLTPMIYQIPAQNNFVQDENINDHRGAFLSPIQEIPQSPQNSPSTPGLKRKIKKKQGKGCFPRISVGGLKKNLKKFKFQARKVLKKNTHPIFRL